MRIYILQMLLEGIYKLVREEIRLAFTEPKTLG